MAESRYEAVKGGTTPDGKWTWYAVSQWVGVNQHILGIIAESEEMKYFGSEETHRYYRTMMYEPGYGEGTMMYSTAKSVEDASAHMIERYEKMAKIKAERGQ